MDEKQTIAPVDKALWFEIETRESEVVSKAFESERKNRGKREFILVIICFLALLYTYPIQDFEKNPNIEIPSISLKIPLRDAIAVFPTIIAAIYLVYLSSALSESVLMVRRSRYGRELNEFKETGQVSKVSPRDIHLKTARYLFLPSALHSKGFAFGAAALPKAIVDAFVGTIFTLLPYVTLLFILIRFWKLTHNKVVFSWDVICFLIMSLAFTSALLSTRPSSRGSVHW